MKTKYTFFLALFFIGCLTHAQTKKEYCEQWRAEKDTISDVDFYFEYNKIMMAKVDETCLTDIYMSQAYIYEIKKNTDSSLYYYDKVAILAKNTDSEELLLSTYVYKAYALLNNYRKDETIPILQKARSILSKDPDNSSWHLYYTLKSMSARDDNEYGKAINYIDSSIVVLKRIKDTVNLLDAYQNKGAYYLHLDNYTKAAEIFLQTIETDEKPSDLLRLIGTYYNLGFCYVKLDKSETAIKYFNEGILRAKKIGNDYEIASFHLALAGRYRELKEYDKAIDNVDSASDISQKMKHNDLIIEGLQHKGMIYYDSSLDYDKAGICFIKAYKMSKELNIEKTLPSLFGIIKVYLKKGEYNKVKEYLKPFEEAVNKIRELDSKKEFHKIYSEYYEKTKQFTSALEHFKKYHSIKDSISSQEVQTKIADLEKKYDTKKKELAIVNLNQEKEEQQLITKQAKTQQNLYLLAASFLFLLLLLGAWAFRKLRKQQKQLASTNQVKNRLFSIIAHDLRGMILPFQRSGKILKYHIDKGNHEKTIEISQALEKNSESLSNMLDNLLNWSLEQMNGYKMNLQTILVSEELKEIVSGYKQQASYKKTKIDLKFKEDLRITFDKGAFHVIFRNLIGNALKYTEEGNIRIEFSSENDMFLCSVIDTGIGISENQLQNIFTLEEKKSIIGTQGEKGTGLGLNLVYRFVKMHKGTINVSSEKRIGTRFDLSIPITISLTKEEGAISKPLSA
ncbi:tetratricopeptide repeat-containing sensor histidine kinase [uncultured Aquimarina sp.]|uniref:tetratricopeptide repeat-containing sensor histidine kinase n=1 Tax=uncultured Aquimarina sp. TaxID=575652 RepID=UPI002636D48C|nr:tetratricopeptide repeat-containing sensor histidine kinase [uncultured Aquimarina sp.]